MANANFSDWSLAELLDAKDEIEKLIIKKDEEQKRQLLEQFKRDAQEKGYTLEELLKTNTSTKSTRTVKAKYQNPDNTSETWSGRGRTPKWFTQCIEAGKSETDLLI